MEKNRRPILISKKDQAYFRMDEALPRLPKMPAPIGPEAQLLESARSVTAAAKAVKATAEKWEQIPDAILSVQTPVTLGIGIVVTLVVMSLFQRRSS